jgi:predicted lipoprotein with Yx(FWY)xxD motif
VIRLVSVLLGFLLASQGNAKEAVTDAPLGVTFAKTDQGRVFATNDHRTLYTLIMRTARSRSGFRLAPSEYCVGPCADLWTPLTPAKDAAPVGKWTILSGAKGPQWAYDRNPVFSFNADKRAGDRKGHRYMEMWLAIPYIPPQPKIVTPPNVEMRLVDEVYRLTDAQGRSLVLADGKKPCNCAPFAAGMASLPIGDWSVLQTGDTPQWALRGKPVFVRTADGGGKVIEP